MPSELRPFDLGALYRAADRARRERGLSWAAVARKVGVAASTIRRFERADDAEADGVLALIGWLGVAPEGFVDGTTVTGEVLPPAGAGMVRADARTSIQRLVTMAQTTDRTVASLTRWSEM